jgi:hypothetical protein
MFTTTNKLFFRKWRWNIKFTKQELLHFSQQWKFIDPNFNAVEPLIFERHQYFILHFPDASRSKLMSLADQLVANDSKIKFIRNTFHEGNQELSANRILVSYNPIKGDSELENSTSFQGYNHYVKKAKYGGRQGPVFVTNIGTFHYFEKEVV